MLTSVRCFRNTKIFILTLKSIVPSDNEVITEQISFVLGANFVLSFLERKADFFEHLRFRLRESKGS
jgi:magnesium transporter